jgi:hypothetical protein
MSNADRRKEQKARKERLIRKKQVQAQERQEGQRDKLFALVWDELRDKVNSGAARFGLCSIPQFQVFLAAMWTTDGIKVTSYNSKQEASLTMLADAGMQHASPDEWMEFMTAHMDKVVEVEDGQLAMTMIPWKPGERPLSPKPGN